MSSWPRLRGKNASPGVVILVGIWDISLSALLGGVWIEAENEDIRTAGMIERPKDEAEVVEATLVFLGCLVAAVFLAAAMPEETRGRAAFPLFFCVSGGRRDFLTMSPDRMVPLLDLWGGGDCGGFR